MTRFNATWAAGALVLASGLYMTLSLATGRSARSEPPPDLSAGAAESGLDVWKTAAALLASTPALVVDLRPAADFAEYHVPGAISAPSADAAELTAFAKDHSTIILVAAKDDVARRLVGEAHALDQQGRYYFLQDGVRSWYLALDLPVPLFNETPPPRGYSEALRELRSSFATSAAEARERALASVQTLAKLAYAPTLLQQAGKPKAAGQRKKIAGGCGG